MEASCGKRPQPLLEITFVILEYRVAERVEIVQERPVFFSHFPHKR